jgi:hypothetical protein
MFNSCEHNDCLVIYDTIDCPLCLMEDNINNLNETIGELENKIKELEN